MAQMKPDQSLPDASRPFHLALRPRLHFQTHSILAPIPSGVTKSQQETPQPAKQFHQYAKLSTMLEETLKELELVKSQSRELVFKNKKLARENMAAQMDLEVECGTSASLRRELDDAVSINAEILRRMQEQEDSNEELRRALYAEKAFSGELLRQSDREKLTTAELEYESSKVEAKNLKDKEARES